MRYIAKAQESDRAEVLALYKAQLGREFCPWNEYYPSDNEITYDLSRNALFVMREDGKIIAAISIEYDENEKKGMCIFEYIYFARPDSILEGMSVHEFREKAGRYLAKQNPVEADIVAAVPDSGVDAALRIFKRIIQIILLG